LATSLISLVSFHLTRLDTLANCDCCDKLDREAEQYKSIYFAKGSVSEAKAAAASLCRLVTKVVDDDLDNGFAIIRPPGHHAEPGMAGGYCIINNVAVAAAYAREKLGVKPVLIVDWDVHHGNGTQSIFLNDPDVLYFSVHRWHRGCFFPFLQNGGPTNVGIDEGKGFNVNVGWTRKGMGDAEYLAVWEKLLMPMATEFQPELVLVSAGFDAAIGDMGKCLDIGGISFLFSSKSSRSLLFQENAMSHLNALEG
jgi:acetoin utilization deacetylase AcuC-like enzyme